MFKVINLNNILNVLGISILLESVFILSTVPIAWLYHDTTLSGIYTSFYVSFVSGVLLILFTRKKCSPISKRESFYIATLVWLSMSVIGAFPYIFTGYISTWENAFFESVSGFTTTGSTILNDIEALPKSLLYWRALTHWIGGLGILVLVVALIPFMQSSGSNLMFGEGSILDTEKIKPRVIQVAKRLWFVYLILTLLETGLLKLEGMSLFDAVCHSYATIATGGFSTKNNSVITMSPVIQYTITVFMVLAGMNFVLLYQFGKLKFKHILSNAELKYYLGIILASTIFITFHEETNLQNIEPAFRSALFQVSSIITATGFASDDYELWRKGSQAVIVMLMLTGACVGSTGGGIKIKRHVIIIKSLKHQFKTLMHPDAVTQVKFDNQPFKKEIFNRVGTFTAVYLFTILAGTLVLQLCGIDHTTSFSAVMTTLGGIGPGFGKVGPIDNFAAMPLFSKLYLSLNMILGRLEILPVLALFHPAIRHS